MNDKSLNTYSKDQPNHTKKQKVNTTPIKSINLTTKNIDNIWSKLYIQ